MSAKWKADLIIESSDHMLTDEPLVENNAKMSNNLFAKPNIKVEEKSFFILERSKSNFTCLIFT